MAIATRTTTKKALGTPKRFPAADGDDGVRHATHGRVADRQFEREPPADAEGCQRDDEGMRQAPEHIDGAVDEADQRAGGEDRQDDQRRRVGDLEQEAADDGGQREVRADRKVDAAGQDDQMLTERDDGDDRRLREDVLDVDGRQEIRRQKADHHHQSDEDQQRADADEPQAERNDGRSASALAPRRGILRPLAHRPLNRIFRRVTGVPYGQKSMPLGQSQTRGAVNMFFTCKNSNPKGFQEQPEDGVYIQ